MSRTRDRETPLTEQDFWSRLEWWTCERLEQDAKASSRGLWCDGFIPLDYGPNEIAGKIWLGIGPRNQVEWTFKLELPRRSRGTPPGDWTTILDRIAEGARLDIDWDASTITIHRPGNRRKPRQLGGA